MRAKPAPQSICFGKLPIAGDFLRGDGAAREFSELDDWIQHGMYESQKQVGNDWQARFDALPRTKFLWTNGAGTVIAGWWQASQDGVGRRYPFLLAAYLPKVQKQDLAAVPFALAEYFDNAEQLLDTSFDGHNTVSAIEAAQNLPCNIDWDAARQQAHNAQQSAAPQEAWAGHDDEPELLLHDLEQVCGQYNPPLYSLRWASRGDASDTSFWLAAMAQFGHPTPRLVMWHPAQAGSDNQKGCTRVIMSQLQPRQFAGAVFFDLDDDDAYNMGHGAGEDKRTQQARTRFAQVVRANSQAAVIATLPTEAI